MRREWNGNKAEDVVQSNFAATTNCKMMNGFGMVLLRFPFWPGMLALELCKANGMHKLDWRPVTTGARTTDV